MKIKYLTAIILLLVFSSIQFAQVSGYTTYRSLNQLLTDYQGLESAHPSLISHLDIGVTAVNKTMILYMVGNQSGAPVLIDANIHGMEVVTGEALYYSVEWLLKANTSITRTILSRNLVLVIPVINMDLYGKSRCNAQNVDLNRNFPFGWGTLTYKDSWGRNYRGSYPLSTPEDQAVAAVFNTYQPKWYITLHSGYSRISPPWGSLSYTANSTYYKSVYSTYSSQVKSSRLSPIPYQNCNNYAGGMSRDYAASLGAYVFEVELSSSHKPTYSTVKSRYSIHVNSLLYAACTAAHSLANTNT